MLLGSVSVLAGVLLCNRLVVSSRGSGSDGNVEAINLSMVPLVDAASRVASGIAGRVLVGLPRGAPLNISSVLLHLPDISAFVLGGCLRAPFGLPQA